MATQLQYNPEHCCAQGSSTTGILAKRCLRIRSPLVYWQMCLVFVRCWEDRDCSSLPCFSVNEPRFSGCNIYTKCHVFQLTARDRCSAQWEYVHKYSIRPKSSPARSSKTAVVTFQLVISHNSSSDVHECTAYSAAGRYGIIPVKPLQLRSSASRGTRARLTCCEASCAR